MLSSSERSEIEEELECLLRIFLLKDLLTDYDGDSLVRIDGVIEDLETFPDLNSWWRSGPYPRGTKCTFLVDITREGEYRLFARVRGELVFSNRSKSLLPQYVELYKRGYHRD